MSARVAAALCLVLAAGLVRAPSDRQASATVARQKVQVCTNINGGIGDGAPYDYYGLSPATKHAFRFSSGSHHVDVEPVLAPNAKCRLLGAFAVGTTITVTESIPGVGVPSAHGRQSGAGVSGIRVDPGSAAMSKSRRAWRVKILVPNQQSGPVRITFSNQWICAVQGYDPGSMQEFGTCQEMVQGLQSISAQTTHYTFDAGSFSPGDTGEIGWTATRGPLPRSALITAVTSNGTRALTHFE